MSEGTYVYAVCRTRPRDVETITGVAGAPVRTIEHADLVALVSTVDLAEYGEDGLTRNLEDLQWLEATARAHNEVISAAATMAKVSPIAPFRLVTVYASDERVKTVLDERRDELVETLDRIRGRTEWGVKVYADPESLRASTEPTEQQSSGRPGTAYLLRRRTEQRDQDQARGAAEDLADRIHTRLAAMSDASLLHPPQDPRLTGHSGWMVLNGSYLVADARADEFAGVVTALDEEFSAERFELTGPWAPYSFATTEGST